MNLKLMAFVIFAVGVVILAGLFMNEAKKRRNPIVPDNSPAPGNEKPTARAVNKKNKSGATNLPSVHDFFNDDVADSLYVEQEMPDGNPASELSRLPASLTINNENLEKDNQHADFNVIGHFPEPELHALYGRLEEMLSGDYRISPSISVSEIITVTGNVPRHNAQISGMSFDFLMTDLDTGALRCVIISKESSTRWIVWKTIITLLKEKGIAVFIYDKANSCSDDELSDQICNLIDEVAHA